MRLFMYSVGIAIAVLTVHLYLRDGWSLPLVGLGLIAIGTIIKNGGYLLVVSAHANACENFDDGSRI